MCVDRSSMSRLLPVSIRTSCWFFRERRQCVAVDSCGCVSSSTRAARAALAGEWARLGHATNHWCVRWSPSCRPHACRDMIVNLLLMTTEHILGHCETLQRDADAQVGRHLRFDQGRRLTVRMRRVRALAWLLARQEDQRERTLTRNGRGMPGNVRARGVSGTAAPFRPLEAPWQ